MDALVSAPYLVVVVAGVVTERFHESNLAVEGAQVFAFEVDVQVRVDPDERVPLVPALDVDVVARPRLEADEPSLTRLPLRLVQ